MTAILLSGPQSTSIKARGRTLLNFASNDYLKLANHPDIVQAGITCLQRSGAGVSSVAFISGYHEVHAELEALTSDLLHSEDSLLFSSCYTANVALFNAMYGQRDFIVSDKLNHASLIDGIRLTRSTRAVFAHNDLTALRAILADRGRYDRCAIVSDTVFSMEGDYADVEGLRALASEFNCDLILDHSHLIGTQLPDGVGAFTWDPLPNTNFLITGTFGKALGGSAGGFISGSKKVIDALRNKARPYVFSNLMPPVLASIAAEAILVMRREPWRLERLHQNVATFAGLAASMDISIPEQHRHPIVPLHGVDDSAVLSASNLLDDHDIHAVAMTYPVVPAAEGRIRVQLTCGHTEEDMVKLLSIWRQCQRGSDTI